MVAVRSTMWSTTRCIAAVLTLPELCVNSPSTLAEYDTPARWRSSAAPRDAHPPAVGVSGPRSLPVAKTKSSGAKASATRAALKSTAHVLSGSTHDPVAPPSLPAAHGGAAGDVDVIEVGAFVGPVGYTLGLDDGEIVGNLVVGLREGLTDGDELGEVVGRVVGNAEGAQVFRSVGLFVSVGRLVGSFVGSVGDRVGLHVGEASS